VHSGARASTGSMGLNVLVQSERDSVYLETRVEALFDYLKEFLDNLEEVEFEKHKTGVINKKLEKPKNLHGEASRFWGAIGDGYYDFERRKCSTHLRYEATTEFFSFVIQVSEMQNLPRPLPNKKSLICSWSGSITLPPSGGN
jgi:secreted Zn-dependent insulinase-like peptidase